MKNIIKQITDKVLSPQLFLLCYVPWLAINMVTVVNIMPFTRIVLILFAVWGLSIAVREYFFGGIQPWIHKGIAVLMFFLAACLLSKVLLFKYGGFDLIGKLCYFALCILVLYPQRRLKSEDYIKIFSVLVRTLGIIIGVMMLLSDWMFISVFSSQITIRAGGTAFLGFAENRLYGIFTSPNVGGGYALILLWCSFVTLLWSKTMRHKTLWRVLAAIQIAAGVMYISVALSRGTYLMGLAMVLCYLVLRPPFAREKTLKTWKQVSVRVLSLVAAVFVCVGVLNGVNRVSCAVMAWNYETNLKPQLEAEKEQESQQTTVSTQSSDQQTTVGSQSTTQQTSTATQSTTQQTTTTTQSTTQQTTATTGTTVNKQEQMQAIVDNAQLGAAGRVESDRDDIDITNKRTRIWKSNLSLLKGKHLLIGVNHPAQYLEKTMAAGATYPKEVITFVKYPDGNLHNGYLQILVSGGLLAFLPMLAFLAWCAYLAVRYMSKTLLKGKASADSSAYALFSVTLPMVIGILVDNVVETNFVLMGANFIQAFFWTVAGACVLSMLEGVKE